MEQSMLDKLLIEELETWKLELEREDKRLSNELDTMKEKLERTKIRYAAAHKAYGRSHIDLINDEYVKPLLEEMQTLRKEIDAKTLENNQKIYAIQSLLETVKTKIKVNS
jgi:hypothetical protein